MCVCAGNISAGKSTLSRDLADALGYRLFLEPTVTNPYLEKYYAEPKKYALPMQMWLLKQRYVTFVAALREVLDDPDNRGIILDRSVFSDIVFGEKNFMDGNFSREGYDYYLELRRKMLASIPPPHVVLYLDVTAEECHRRIHHTRKRDCEDGIPLAYLQGLDDCYKRFLDAMTDTGAAVLSVDWNKFGDVADVAAAVAKIPTPAVDEWLSAAAAELVRCPDAVKANMSLGYTPEEARGSDVDAADPELVTAAESAATPLVTPARGGKSVPPPSGSPGASRASSVTSESEASTDFCDEPSVDIDEEAASGAPVAGAGAAAKAAPVTAASEEAAAAATAAAAASTAVGEEAQARFSLRDALLMV